MCNEIDFNVISFYNFIYEKVFLVVLFIINDKNEMFVFVILLL